MEDLQLLSMFVNPLAFVSIVHIVILCAEDMCIMPVIFETGCS